MSTQQEVADRAGVSTSAVSRCFTVGASVSPKTRKKVLRAAKELDYSPNILARSLTTQKTGIIGLVINDARNPVMLEAVGLLTIRLQEQGFRPMLFGLSELQARNDAVRFLRGYCVEGVIVVSSSLSSRVANTIRSAGISVVQAFGNVSGQADIDVVGIDNIACGRVAAASLLELGYTKFGFLGGPENAVCTQDRLAGFRTSLQGKSEPALKVQFAAGYSYSDGYEVIARTEYQDLPEVFFCADDQIAIGAMHAAQARGLRVWQDIGFLGVNNLEATRWPGINLSTVHQPIADIVEVSVSVLMTTMSTVLEAPITCKLPFEVILRRTTKPHT
jgi:DNA-binding LacI/PurR family transcriptional regulator